MNPTAMESPARAGDLLKQARLKQRLDVAECSRRTHIAQRYMEALEDNRWHDLPSESHRQGFITLYARFLGLSGDEVLALYKQEKKPAVGRFFARVASRLRNLPRPSLQVRPGKSRVFLPSSVQWVGILIFRLAVRTWGRVSFIERKHVRVPDSSPGRIRIPGCWNRAWWFRTRS